MKKEIKNVHGLARDYRVTKGSKFHLRACDPGGTGKFKTDDQARELLLHGIKRLSEMQEKLYAQDRWSLLLIFQAMDAAGKDSAIKHVMSGINPQGCQVTAFKAPSAIELDHDFLWRSQAAMPRRGEIGIFNRSYYEEVLVVRVHKEILKAEKLPETLVTKHLWKERYEDINAYERYLSRNGTVIRKFFLHVSKAEQKSRFLSRIDEAAKNWKFSAADLKERSYWDDYQDAYEAVIRHTATEDAPWYVVPADNKWFTHLVVAEAILEALDSLNLRYPAITDDQRNALQEARKALTD